MHVLALICTRQRSIPKAKAAFMIKINNDLDRCFLKKRKLFAIAPLIKPS